MENHPIERCRRHTAVNSIRRKLAFVSQQLAEGRSSHRIKGFGLRFSGTGIHVKLYLELSGPSNPDSDNQIIVSALLWESTDNQVALKLKFLQLFWGGGSK